MLQISLAILGSVSFSQGMLMYSKKLIIFLFLLASMASLRSSLFQPQRQCSILSIYLNWSVSQRMCLNQWQYFRRKGSYRDRQAIVQRSPYSSRQVLQIWSIFYSLILGLELRKYKMLSRQGKLVRDCYSSLQKAFLFFSGRSLVAKLSLSQILRFSLANILEQSFSGSMRVSSWSTEFPRRWKANLMQSLPWVAWQREAKIIRQSRFILRHSTFRGMDLIQRNFCLESSSKTLTKLPIPPRLSLEDRKDISYRSLFKN